MARSSKDKSLENEYMIPDWIEPIHAGAALDNRNLGFLKDDTNDNLSLKNRDYCELTALYWIWKNDKHEYKGLCHYRRVFRVFKEDFSSVQREKPDVILPYPTIHYPNIKSQYNRYLSKKEWEIMQEAVFMVSPCMKDNWDEVWEDKYFYNYNMLIARHEILNAFCHWLFLILEIVEEMCFKQKVPTSSRYAGYMGEILTTIYFRYNRKNIKMVHTGVDFLM